MKKSLSRHLGLLPVVLLLACGAQDQEEKESVIEKTELFEGQALGGWSTTNAEYWSVEDGAIVAAANEQVPKNEFLGQPWK